MPVAINEGQADVTTRTLSALYEEFPSYERRYPQGLDLRPDSDAHANILTHLRIMLDDSWASIEDRHAKFDEIDKNLTSYIDLSKEQKEDVAVEGYVKNKQVQIIVPMSYAVLETLVTYMVAAFTDRPIFRYDWVGENDADVIGATALEKIIDVQMSRAKAGLALHTQWRDSIAKGFGVMSVRWKTDTRTIKFKVPTFKRNYLMRRVKTGEREEIQEVIEFEGNVLENIEPKSFLPDPNVSIHDVQKGEMTGWVDRTNLMNLLTDEQYDEKMFNVNYIRSLSNPISKYKEASASEAGEKSKRPENRSRTSTLTKAVDIVYMYVKLVPKDWGLGSFKYPQKWVFAIAGDQIIIKASPVGLNHNMFPVVIASPDYDGYSTSPISKLETIMPLQHTVDWLFTSHIANVRKAINDIIIYNPNMINSLDLEHPTPGMRVRMRENAFHAGQSIDHYIKQFNVNDVTANHINDANVLTDFAYRYSGAVDSLQGVVSGGERRSATEAQQTHTSALNRLARMAYVISQQSMVDIARISAYQTQQLITKETYAKISGDLQTDLMKEYGIKLPVRRGRMAISPDMLKIPFDVIPGDGTMPSGQNVTALIQAFQTAASNPALAAELDMGRLFIHLMRVSGVRNIEQFRVRTAPQEEIDRGVQSGNLASTQEVTRSDIAA